MLVRLPSDRHGSRKIRTSTGSTCNYPAHICAVCLRGGTYTRLGSITRASCTARFVPFYKQRTHQLSDAPRRPGRSGRPSSVCRSRWSVVGRWAGRSGRSTGSVGRRLVGRAAGRLLGRSANRTGRSVHPIGPSIRPIGRLGGGSVGGTGRTLKQA